MSHDTTGITAEWALWGKPAGSSEDYEVLDTSPGRLDRPTFAKIILRYGSGASGMSGKLPQVTTSWVGGGRDTYLGIAIQDWSDHVDGARRRIAETRYYCVPYDQAARLPVSYEALYEAFDPCRLPAAGPIEVSVPALDPGRVMESVDATAKNAAALLLTGKYVCVLQGDHVDLTERLRFLDAVAALLPYGLRTKLTTSTLTNSAANHRIRLSFATNARTDSNAIPWKGLPAVAPDGLAGQYLELLNRHPDPPALITGLASMTDPLSFKEPGDCRQALRLLEGLVRPSVHQPRLPILPVRREPTPATAADLLTRIADRVPKPDPLGDVYQYVLELKEIAGRLTQEGRERGRAVVRERDLLRVRFKTDTAFTWPFLDAIVAAAYGPSLTSEVMNEIVRDAGGVTPPLLGAMRNLPPADGVAAVTMAFHSAGDDRIRILTGLDSAALVAAADRRPFDAGVVGLVCEELTRRGGGTDEGEAAAIAAAFQDHGYLAEAVCCLHSGGEQRLTGIQDLLTAAYGSDLDAKEFEEVVGHPAALSCELLMVAAILKYGDHASERLLPTVMNAVMERSGLGENTRTRVRGLLVPPRATVPDTRAPGAYLVVPDETRTDLPLGGGGVGARLTARGRTLLASVAIAGLIVIGLIIWAVWLLMPSDGDGQQQQPAPAKSVRTTGPEFPLQTPGIDPDGPRRGRPFGP